MTNIYTSDNLRNLFQSSFNLAQWYSFLQYFFNATELKSTPERIIENTSDDGYYLGNIDTTDSYRIGLFQYNITKGSVANKRVGLRNLVKSFINPTWGEFDAALVVFDSGDHWRLSFICDIKGEATSPKRYTYVFGSNDLLYRTPIERFNFLKKKGVSFENLKTAFSVEALSDEFFDKYREQYDDFIQYITGKRFVKVGSKWEEKVRSESNAALMQVFGHNEKKIRDYVKKMMGRITFLHFLQRKGWMCGDLNYMQNMFEKSAYKNDYLDSVLEPLFFGILNTKPAEREALFTDYGWDKSLLNEWKDIPYLNGGLFERDEEDEPESRFPAEYFKRLFQFFSEYNFTIDENDPNDAEVGVDPEMLGKIFENLLEDNKDKGAFYTPKEIVRYMCQESLIAYL
ncbi:MAG: restriction endonuclease, partial [Bacteroidales bacterium]|nr:restriction endonuclease [Bacteroidales bacterium]